MKVCGILLSLTLAAPMSSGSNEEALCAVDVDQYELAQGLTMSQETTPVGARFRLVYEGHGWLGFGFSESRQMVGSTVVIGLPGQSNAEGLNPGRYYLANKDLADIRPLAEEAGDVSVVSIVQTNQASVSTGAPSVVSTAEEPTQAPVAIMDAPSTATVVSTVQTNQADESTGAPSVVSTTEEPTQTPVAIADAPSTAPVTNTPSAAPVTGQPTPQSIVSRRTTGPTNWWEWERQLRPAHEARTLSLAPGATVTQNDTHTVMIFTRPLLLNGVLPADEASFDTFLYAVGTDNELGYHDLRGAVSMAFAFQSCHNNPTTQEKEASAGIATQRPTTAWTLLLILSSWLAFLFG